MKVMKRRPSILTRRNLLVGGTALVGWGALTAAGGALVATPRQTRGPFYPDRLPLDADNDLVTIAGRDGRAPAQAPG